MRINSETHCLRERCADAVILFNSFYFSLRFYGTSASFRTSAKLCKRQNRLSDAGLRKPLVFFICVLAPPLAARICKSSAQVQRERQPPLRSCSRSSCSNFCVAGGKQIISSALLQNPVVSHSAPPRAVFLLSVLLPSC